jgi:hypothetical protein
MEMSANIPVQKGKSSHTAAQDEIWEDARPEIEQMYQKHKLEVVMATFKVSHGIDAK